VESTWENRDLPVLEAIVRLNDQLDDLFGIEALLAAVPSLSDAVKCRPRFALSATSSPPSSLEANESRRERECSAWFDKQPTKGR